MPYLATASGSPYLVPGDPATTDGPPDGLLWPQNQPLGAFTYNGAVGLIGDPDLTILTPNGVTATATATVAGGIISDVILNNGGGADTSDRRR